MGLGWLLLDDRQKLLIQNSFEVWAGEMSLIDLAFWGFSLSISGFLRLWVSDYVYGVAAWLEIESSVLRRVCRGL